ncbi:hypothetical protein E2C01_042936 [Portunus trituberculatus]|uniref:THAP-type domain-containing protein n=1 Tax=Portunus trituberculatus TaxID=210409 RepID=A0A5B7FNW1_PORTR|nr:hypothetical protein [Portunus trituberculatus]
MGRNTTYSSCCLCGKKKKTHPGVKLHAFPKDTKRCVEWQKVLKMKLKNSSQAICGDHFDAKWLGIKGRLPSNAVPNPTVYDSNFGCLSEDSFNQVPLLVEEVYWW